MCCGVYILRSAYLDRPGGFRDSRFLSPGGVFTPYSSFCVDGVFPLWGPRVTSALAVPTRRLPRSADCSICPLHEASSPSRPAFIRRTLQLAARSICTVGLRLACGQSDADRRGPPPPPHPPPPPPVNLQTAPNAAGNPRAEGEPARVRIPHPSSMEVASHPPSGSPSWLLVRLDGRRRQGRPVRLDGRRGQGGRSSGGTFWCLSEGTKSSGYEFLSAVFPSLFLLLLEMPLGQGQSAGNDGSVVGCCSFCSKVCAYSDLVYDVVGAYVLFPFSMSIKK